MPFWLCSTYYSFIFSVTQTHLPSDTTTHSQSLTVIVFFPPWPICHPLPVPLFLAAQPNPTGTHHLALAKSSLCRMWLHCLKSSHLPFSCTIRVAMQHSTAPRHSLTLHVPQIAPLRPSSRWHQGGVGASELTRGEGLEHQFISVLCLQIWAGHHVPQPSDNEQPPWPPLNTPFLLPLSQSGNLLPWFSFSSSVDCVARGWAPMPLKFCGRWCLSVMMINRYR
jgi:hypothetical protein